MFKVGKQAEAKAGRAPEPTIALKTIIKRGAADGPEARFAAPRDPLKQSFTYRFSFFHDPREIPRSA
jgi:hypothetical protein